MRHRQHGSSVSKGEAFASVPLWNTQNVHDAVAASRGKLGAVGHRAVPGVSPIVLICIRFSAPTPNPRHRRYKRIQFPASLTGRTAL